MSQLLTSHLLLSFPLTGHCMVVREGLTNPWIPDNWSWGGVASDHCPVVAEFYPDVSSKELTRAGVAVVDRGDIMPKHERWQHPQSQWKDENGWPLILSCLDPALFLGGRVGWVGGFFLHEYDGMGKLPFRFQFINVILAGKSESHKMLRLNRYNEFKNEMCQTFSTCI